MYECTLYMYKYERKLLNMKLLCVKHTHVCRFCFHMNSFVRLVGHRQQRNYTSNAPIGANVVTKNLTYMPRFWTSKVRTAALTALDRLLKRNVEKDSEETK